MVDKEAILGDFIPKLDLTKSRNSSSGPTDKKEKAPVTENIPQDASKDNKTEELTVSIASSTNHMIPVDGSGKTLLMKQLEQENILLKGKIIDEYNENKRQKLKVAKNRE